MAVHVASAGSAPHVASEVLQLEIETLPSLIGYVIETDDRAQTLLNMSMWESVDRYLPTVGERVRPRALERSRAMAGNGQRDAIASHMRWAAS